MRYRFARPHVMLAVAAALGWQLMLVVPGLAQTADDVDVVQRALPASVSVTVWSVEQNDVGGAPKAGGKSQHLRQAFGSGFVIDPSGIIATNRHVLDGAVEITVRLADRRRFPATVLASAGPSDIALIKVNVPTPLPVLHFVSSSQARIGERVWVIGNPLGVGLSVASGVLSSKTPDAKTKIYNDFIQTDAPINRGSSGAPLVDMQGNVIGIATSFYTADAGSGSIGVGLAIASDDAMPTITDLLRYGHLRAGWLDLALQDVTPEIAQAVGLDVAHGAIVAALNGRPGNDPQAVMPGDVILKFGDVTPADARAVVRAAMATPVGQSVPLIVWRHGAQHTAHVTVVDWPAGPALTATTPRIGAATLANLGMHLGDATHPAGVAVVKVDSHTATSTSGISTGDVLVQVQDTIVTSASQAQRAFAAAEDDKRGFVLLLVRQQGAQRWIALPLDPTTLAHR